MSKYYVYKYVFDDEIVYIGKSKNIDARIKQHEAEEKFKAYIKRCKIYVAECVNSVEMDIIERALINQYKPILNVVDKTKGFSGLIKIEEPIFKVFTFKKNQKKSSNDNANGIKRLEGERLKYYKDQNEKSYAIYQYIVRCLKEGNYSVTDYFSETKFEIDVPDIFVGFYNIQMYYREGHNFEGVNLPVVIETDLNHDNWKYLVDSDFLENLYVKKALENYKRRNMND